ncbi:hypothetical protein J6590_048928 [Homalodisca vitripennis]|nr:hypothetical protein J6590_048928 [Homalodisca vitripennis]
MEVMQVFDKWKPLIRPLVEFPVVWIPSMGNSSTIKKTQFCLAFIHSFQLLIYDCEYPRFSLILILPNAVFFYYLFNDFYNKAYPHRRLQQLQKQQQQKELLKRQQEQKENKSE